MTDNLSWSASLGRWLGIPVRVHLFYFLFIALIFAIQSNYQSVNVLGTAFATTCCLFVCVLLHELAHVFALTNLGGHVNTIVFTPWGGNSNFSYPESARAQAVVHLAGPLFNACLFVLGASLLVQTEHAKLAELVIPFRPGPFEMNNWEVSLVRIMTWINFQLMVVNLIPCFPFDGAGLLRALIGRFCAGATILRRESTMLAIGQATGITLIGCGWFLRDYVGGPIHPVWFLFVASGLTLFFAARYSYFQQVAATQDPHWDHPVDQEFDSVYGDSSFLDFSADDHSNYSQWLQEKQEERENREREREAREAGAADEILQKLHRSGIESLTDEEKGVLNRVSVRLRRRRQQGVDFH